MSKLNDTLLEVYKLGFDNELNGQDNKDYLLRAYQIGKLHAILGDEQAKFDSLTGEEILEIIKFEE